MKFGKRYSNITVFMAMLHGVVIGIAAIAVIGFVLAGAEGKRVIDQIEEDIPADGPKAVDPESTPIGTVESFEMFARQHGVFTTSASAATFMAADPSLATAAIIQSSGQFYVWSAVGLTEAEILDSGQEETYKKVFTANTSACEGIGAEKLKEILKADDIEKIKISVSQGDEEKTDEFNRQIAAILAFTDDLRVIRLHLLSQYSYSQDCVKISF